MKSILAFSVLLILTAALSVAADRTPEKVVFCELVGSPDKYDKKLVSTEAVVLSEYTPSLCIVRVADRRSTTTLP